LGTNDIDFRTRAHSEEEADFLAARIAGQPITVDYAAFDTAPIVLLAGFEPEEESPIVYLRLRKAARKHGLPVYALAPFATTGLHKMSGTLLPTGPGLEAAALEELRADDSRLGEPARLLREPGAVILAGERLAGAPGALSALARLADHTGAALAWVPRRAGERGAIEAGALPGLLPGGRPVIDPQARHQVRTAWNIDELPLTVGRDTTAILAAAATLGALVIGGVDVSDLPDSRTALAAIDAARFVVSLELRRSDITDRADVVFPVATAMEKAGTFLTWEGRIRQFDAALDDPTVRRAPAPPADHRVLHAIADEMGIGLGLPDITCARGELADLGVWDGPPLNAPTQPPQPPSAPPAAGTAVLASWRMLLDRGRMQDGEPHLARTARTPVARLSRDTAAEIGASTGDPVRVSTDHGHITLPLAVTDMPERVVWLPLNSPGSAVYEQLATTPGHLVHIRREDHHE
jgi:NADH-quinone oxidoreductase subunit G